MVRTHSSMSAMWPKDHNEISHVFPERLPHTDKPWDRKFILGFHSQMDRPDAYDPLAGAAEPDWQRYPKLRSGGLTAHRALACGHDIDL